MPSATADVDLRWVLGLAVVGAGVSSPCGCALGVFLAITTVAGRRRVRVRAPGPALERPAAALLLPVRLLLAGLAVSEVVRADRRARARPGRREPVGSGVPVALGDAGRAWSSWSGVPLGLLPAPSTPPAGVSWPRFSPWQVDAEPATSSRAGRGGTTRATRARTAYPRVPTTSSRSHGTRSGRARARVRPGVLGVRERSSTATARRWRRCCCRTGPTAASARWRACTSRRRRRRRTTSSTRRAVDRALVRPARPALRQRSTSTSGVAPAAADRRPLLHGARRRPRSSRPPATHPDLTEVADSGPWHVYEVADSELVAPLENEPAVVDRRRRQPGTTWVDPSRSGSDPNRLGRSARRSSWSTTGRGDVPLEPDERPGRLAAGRRSARPPDVPTPAVDPGRGQRTSRRATTSICFDVDELGVPVARQDLVLPELAGERGRRPVPGHAEPHGGGADRHPRRADLRLHAGRVRRVLADPARPRGAGPAWRRPRLRSRRGPGVDDPFVPARIPCARRGTRRRPQGRGRGDRRARGRADGRR